MLEIRQFRYAHDNLSYLIYGGKQALAIDGGAAGEMLSFSRERGLTLVYVTNTHDHADHTPGNDTLLRSSGATFLADADLPDGYRIDLDGSAVQVLHTPGHTYDSKCFYAENTLIGGDTLFNGTIGNCFTGDIRRFYQSIKRLMALPEETIVYAGHDYVKDSMAFAKYLEPENVEIDRFLHRYDPDHVYSTIADEKLVNPYFRFNEESIVAVLRKRGLPVQTEWERWQSLMRIE
jgi:hydroxyacylglutathione hydrolase